ncbi:HU family DNA-binding protein [Tabrizicola sp. DMG-N-6]|uniref:HU family DNA-binding protein n=2 Tax=Szabonella alba TaxID=2804194 RepID=A0A8K0VDL1_9RHOB|nr:HU family DNA-binding protein [Szabonella alba]
MGAENADADKTEAVTLKKKELLSRVADLSGAKRKDVKPVLEAALRVLGEALSKGEELNLPPLGKVRVNRSKSDAGTDILTLRLRRDTGGKSEEKGGKEGLASEGEDD